MIYLQPKNSFFCHFPPKSLWWK